MSYLINNYTKSQVLFKGDFQISLKRTGTCFTSSRMEFGDTMRQDAQLFSPPYGFSTALVKLVYFVFCTFTFSIMLRISTRLQATVFLRLQRGRFSHRMDLKLKLKMLDTPL